MSKVDYKAVQAFVGRWKGKGYEKGQSQLFWTELLTAVLDVETPSDIIAFEEQVKLDHTAFIDAYIRTTHVMIEQKSIDKDLRAPIRQSDGTLLTPFQQAKRYASELPYSARPRWIVTCNFRSFLVYDMEQPQGEPFELLLEDLEREAHLLRFLVEDKDAHLQHETEVSIQAGEMVGRLYDAFLSQYGGTATPADLHSLNVLCVRIVFCLYAEDAGVFGKDQFADYLQTFRPENMRMALTDLFRTLDTPVEARSRFLEDKLKAFPYVNGSLFRQQLGEDIPPVTEEMADLLLRRASRDFNWSDISPTIFGAVFESTLNPETRRSGGMHYTSIENIHKVIDPLFMDRLHQEFEEICRLPKGRQRTAGLKQFQERMAGLKFLDPACGSGNFLTETYISLRRLENEVIGQLLGGQALLGFEEVSPIKVSIHQFYGIEINDFAVAVAKTALWIAEAQMMGETERIISFNNDYLPLKPYANIYEGNALRTDWSSIVAPEELDYIIGNPPFVGARLMTEAQKNDVVEVFGPKWKNVGNLDYVGCWYKKASDLMRGTHIHTAFVSTNSVTQGEQVANLWAPLMAEGLCINFAHRTFRWDSEATLKAHVHCVIVGFSYNDSQPKTLFGGDGPKLAAHISPYLIDAPDTFIYSRSQPLADVPKIGIGNKPIDGGNYLFEQEEMEAFIRQEPQSACYFHPWYGAEEFIHRCPRYCLWLGDCTPAELRRMPHCLKRVENVRNLRLSSKSEGTRKLADRPTRFHVENMPEGSSIIIPSVSSERRRYVPMGFLEPGTLASNLVLLIPNATLYHFGILTSSVHMAWMRAVCGRLKSDYRYSKDIVYNNFPWPVPTPEQRSRIEKTAQSILDARAAYPDSSLADLYDEVLMPPELRRAHQDNDRAVRTAYGFPTGKEFTESDCVAALMRMYQELADSRKEKDAATVFATGNRKTNKSK
ncbi:MAG: N-6 DNA methylase [Bacteroidales bacterium]|nr:N-6 DNA methylase [Bacteroidales bacterium]